MTQGAGKEHRAVAVWFTGLSGAGKTTIAGLVQHALVREGRPVYVLDGDQVRTGLCSDLGFTARDRAENVRRVAEVAKLFVDAGHIVLVTLISPYCADREKARALFGEGSFMEVFVHAPLEVCIARDPKGLYARARAGAIKDFTGIDSPYEAPIQPDLMLPTAERSATVLAGAVIERVRRLITNSR